MKRKKPATVPAVEVEQVVSAPDAVREGSPQDTVWVCLFSVLLFLSMTIQTGRMSLILAVLALALSIGKGPLRRLRERLCVPVLGLLVFALMNGFAAIYSSFGSYAVKEYYKIFASFALAVILLVRFDKRHVRGLLWGVAAVCAVISLLCVDAACSGPLFNAFNAVAEKLGSTYSTITQASDRVTGLYNDANISASILALGSLISLYLAADEKVLRKRAYSCVLLGISAMGFFMAVSRGAILCFGLSLLVWLVASGRSARLRLFLPMFISAVVTGGLSVFAMPAISQGSVLPDVLTMVSGLIIFVLDWAVGERLARLLTGKGKLLLAAGLAVVLLFGGFLLVALRSTAPYTFDENRILQRSVKLSAGTYEVSGDWDGTPEETGVLIYSRTQEEALLDRSTELYKGSLEGASFTLEDGPVQVYFRFWGPEGDSLRQVVLSDGTELPLRYKLLPVFLAERLQGSLLSSSSFVMRVQFMKDAWTIFTKSPLIGHGLGSTEGLYTAVQPFFYESLYVHSHILQVMDDMGLLGLAAFLALLLGSAWLLLRNLRSGTGGLAAMLLACWVMMNTHCLMEINFSIRAYQCMAFLLLLFPVILYAKPLSEKAVKWGGLAVSACIWLYLAVFGALLESHRMVDREMQEFSTSDVREFMDTLASYVRRDVFDHEQNQLTYVGNAVILDDSRYNGNMRRYAEELRASGTYTGCSGLVRYYYLPKGQFEELFACSREGIAQEASTADAWNLQLNLYRNEVLPAAGVEHMDVFVDGVLALRDYLEEYSQDRLEEIQLTEENQMFLNAVVSAAELELPAEGMYLYLTTMLPGQTGSETPAE